MRLIDADELKRKISYEYMTDQLTAEAYNVVARAIHDALAVPQWHKAPYETPQKEGLYLIYGKYGRSFHYDVYEYSSNQGWTMETREDFEKQDWSFYWSDIPIPNTSDEMW